ncbi:Up-regulated during septation-domain-containing protein [Stachybotrys elegans]|uniref:Up-regulated during septation-domain-containing protein n=1 Tax=Stachybotrys elegans TaxID=80388 RepID=A0A8K0SUH6_9HYPO|nr:Up-regulated during septation-domain-containing protein [Stachybotrys elegans]
MEAQAMGRTSPSDPAGSVGMATQGKALFDAYKKDITAGFEKHGNPTNHDATPSSSLVDLKDPIQVHLLTETALSDSKQYEILSQEEVDDLKKQCQLLSQRIDSTRSNLVIQAKYRDAANSMARLYSPVPGESRGFNNDDEKDAEAERERQESERRCEELATELFNLEKRLMDPHRRLLEHTAGVLQLTHKASKKANAQQNGQPNGGMPGSPESLYTYSHGRNSFDPTSDDLSFYPFDQLDNLQSFREPREKTVTIPLKSPVREQHNQLREEMERLQEENKLLRKETNDLSKSISTMGENLGRLNVALRDTIIRFNPQENGDYDDPPSSTAGSSKPIDMLQAQLDYLESGMVAVQAEQGSMPRGGDHNTDAVLVGLWDVIQNGLAEAKRQKEERRRARMERGLEDDGELSDDDGFDANETYSLTQFSSRVQWLYRQTMTLKDQKGVLKRQIKQQRELNNKSDAEKDSELQRKQEELEESHILIQRAEKDAMDAQRMLSEALEDLEEARNAAGGSRSAEAELEERDAKVQVLEARLTELQESLAEAESDSHNTSHRLAQFDSTLAALSSQLDDTERSKNELNTQLEETIKSRDALNQRLGETDKEVEALTMELNEATKVKAQAEETARSLQQELAEKQADLAAKEAILKKKEEEMDQMNVTLAQLKTEATIARAELDGAYGSRAERAADLAAIKDSADVRNLQNQVATLKNELAETIKELEEMTKETLGAEREKVDLEAKLDDALGVKSTLESELQILGERLESESQKWREKTAKLQEELDGERLKAVPGASRPGAGASLLSEQFRATMREERKKFQEEIREERGRARRLEEELNKLKRAQGPGKSPLSPR